MPVPNEKTSRKYLIDWARKYGCEADLLKLFARYDELLKHSKSDEEKKAISAMGIMEVHNFFGGQNSELVIDGVKIK